MARGSTARRTEARSKPPSAAPLQLKRGQWDPLDRGGRPLEAVPTPETKPPAVASVYALSKYDQERLCLIVGQAYDIPTVALRFFNTYGPHQALSNPYTGVLAIFAARLLNGRPPLIFEDGEQRRDFVYVADIAEACRLALVCDAAVGQAFNIGSGEAVTIREAARLLGETLGVAIEPEITGECRVGDVRHCFPDIGAARAVLGYRPQISLACRSRKAGRLARRADRHRSGRRGARRAGRARADLMTPVSGRAIGTAERRPVLITGGAGFIGTNLADRMLRQGRPVIIYDSLARPGSERNLRWLRATHGSLVRVEIADVRATARLRDARRGSRHRVSSRRRRSP